MGQNDTKNDSVRSITLIVVAAVFSLILLSLGLIYGTEVSEASIVYSHAVTRSLSEATCGSGATH